MIQAPDSFTMPMPDRGWSREIFPIQNAHIWPAGKMARVSVCGITYPDGRDCPEAALYRGNTRMMAPVPSRPAPTARLSGRHMWGGQMFAHFGHFICESLPRLWAHSKVDAESIVVIGKHDNLLRFSPWQERFLKLLDISLPIQFITEPTEVEELLIPGPGFGLGAMAYGTPEFHEMLKSIARHIEPKGAERIYISRTKTGRKGRVMSELNLEQNLQKQGYIPYHPQEHSVEEQIAQYLAATHVIGLDSSAFHLLGLVARPEQRIAVILRRNMNAYHNIQLQLHGMCGHPPDIINVLLGDWMPAKQKQANRNSWGQLDQPQLLSTLTELGYLPRPEEWNLLNEENILKGIDHYRKRLKTEIIFRPVEVPIEEQIRQKEAAAKQLEAEEQIRQAAAQ